MISNQNQNHTPRK